MFLKALFILVSIICCSTLTSAFQTPQNMDEQFYSNEIATWDSLRLQNLKSPAGWLNLAGLHWLKAGINRIGSDEDNDVILHNGPAHLGNMILKNNQVRFSVAEGLSVKADGQTIENETQIFTPDKPAKLITVDSLGLIILQRGERIGIRLRDYAHPRIAQLEKIDRFEPQLDWKIEARYIPGVEELFITVPDVLGDLHQEKVPGILEFEIAGNTHRLFPTAAGNRFFIIFADQTNGVETYGAGRFLYAEAPDENGIVILDFNKAYNPPCAFSPYATCPLPPHENKLPISILAGEKRVLINLE